MRHAILLLVLAAGLSQPFQAAMHAKLGKAGDSPALAAVASTGLAFACALLLWSTGLAGRGSVAGVASAPWWAYLCGPLAILIIVSTLVALPMSNAALVIAVLVFGNGLASLALDHYGWMGVKRVPVNLWRVGGVALLCAGVVLMGVGKK